MTELKNLSQIKLIKCQVGDKNTMITHRNQILKIKFNSFDATIIWSLEQFLRSEDAIEVLTQLIHQLYPSTVITNCEQCNITSEKDIYVVEYSIESIKRRFSFFSLTDATVCMNSLYGLMPKKTVPKKTEVDDE
jgi:hypothetical protein